MPHPLESLPPLTMGAFGHPPWQPPAGLAPASMPARCDVVIVGAGITGLAAAATLADAGRHVVVLERSFGTGATARSGGVVLGETVEGPDPDFNGCDEALRRWIDASAIRCDLAWYGCLELARDPRLSGVPIDWEDGGSVRLAGQVSGGVLDPAKLQAGMAVCAGHAGATIVDGVTVLGAEADAAGVTLSSDRGTMTARYAIMAVDAMSWRAGFDPWPQRVMTITLHTAPLESGDLESLGLGQHLAFYSVDLPLLWGRVMPDRSLLIGRETEPFRDIEQSTNAADGLGRGGARLSSRVRGLHPVLNEINVRAIWTGPIARTAAGHPVIVADPLVPQLWWAGGYGGQGIAQAFRLGQRAAERVLNTS